MKQPVQKRTLKTRARMIEVAETLVAKRGFEALRVEDVVSQAGVAKGTFFAHFKDKDALMDLLIGARIDACLDEWDQLSAPQNTDEIIQAMLPMMRLMICERYVFDVILRYSGAALVSDIGAIAMTFGRQEELIKGWMQAAPFRKDISPALLAEGVQAFVLQALALHFCGLHNSVALEDRLALYLDAWLLPQKL